MPRFTTSPSLSSRAARLAMTTRLSISLALMVALQRPRMRPFPAQYRARYSALGACGAEVRLSRRYARSCARRLPGTDGALLDRLDVALPLEDAVHVGGRGVDMVGMQAAGLDQVLDLRDDDLARGGHDLVEVPRGLAVDQVPPGVALVGL